MRILFLTSRFPYPLEKGDKLRAFHQLRTLAGEHEVILCALTHEDVEEAQLEALRPYCQRIETFRLRKGASYLHALASLLGGRPLQAGFFYRARHARAIRSLIAEARPDLLYAQLLRTAPYLMKEPTPKVLDFQDCFSAGMDRRRMHRRGIPGLVFGIEARLLRAYEARCHQEFDACTIITRQDRDLLAFKDKEEVRVIPNGVDTACFSPRDLEPAHDLLFTGNMSYPPNIDAAVFLARDVLPMVREAVPDASLCIAGASPAPAVQRLQGRGVRVTGWVDDIRDYYAATRIFIAPMRIGTGLQNKLLEAMAMRKPCITTSLAVLPLGAGAGTDILVGDDARSLADHCVSLLSHPAEATRLALSGHQFLLAHYSWESATRELDRLFHETAGQGKGRPQQGAASPPDRS